MGKKLSYRNKPLEDSFGIYTNLDTNNSTNYYDSDSLPIRYDKFIGRDLYSTSVGSNINEVILDSKIKNNFKPEVDDLKLTGDSFIQINSLNIVNRGVRSRINDVFFRFFIFSKAFFNPFRSDGKTLRSFGELRAGMQGSGDIGGDSTSGAAWFYNQNGPNYGKRGAPGNFGALQNLIIVNNFDTSNYGAAGDATFASSPDFYGKWSQFNPIVALRKSSVTTTVETNLDNYPNGWNLDFGSDYIGDITNLFQEDFEDADANKCYFGIHMDGDLNPKYGSDRSRDETICIYEFSPQELFEGGAGKVTQLDWDSPTATRYSNNQSYTAAFIGRELRITINTIGGVKLAASHGGEAGGTYTPPQQYVDSGIYKQVIGPLERDLQTLDDTILNAFPNREIKTTAGPTSDDLDIDGIGFQEHYFCGIFGDYFPVPKIEVYGKDLQMYYQNKDDKIIASAPNTVELIHEISLHPSPLIGYSDLEENEGRIIQDAYDLIHSTTSGPAPGQNPKSTAGDGNSGWGGTGGSAYNGLPYGLGYPEGETYGPDDPFAWIIQEESSFNPAYARISTDPSYPSKFYGDDPDGYNQIRTIDPLRDILYEGILTGVPYYEEAAQPTPENIANVIGSDNAASAGYTGDYIGPMYIRMGNEWFQVEDFDGGQWVQDIDSTSFSAGRGYMPLKLKLKRAQSHPVITGQSSVPYPHGSYIVNFYLNDLPIIEQVQEWFADGAAHEPEIVEIWKFRERVEYTSDIFAEIPYRLSYDNENYFTAGTGFELLDKTTDNTNYSFYGRDIDQSGTIDSVFSVSNDNSLEYKHFVVDWDDESDKYKTIDNVLEDWPRDKTELLTKQNENLFIPLDIKEPLKHNYLTPGMKTIKSIVFSYKEDNTIINGSRKYPNYEPLRWKLVTSRIFLDIPISEYPDFGEVGGDDYTTIPWPYTSPVIGGVSENSKYKKSVSDVLGGGKIGKQDVIDETFLVDAVFNDELGENIEKMDLEQVRYFNKSYDIHELLNISQFVSPGISPYESITVEEFFGLPQFTTNSEAIWTVVEGNIHDDTVAIPASCDWEVYEIEVDEFGNQIGNETFFNRWNSPLNGSNWTEPGKLIKPGNYYKIKILLNNPYDLYNGYMQPSDPPPYIEWPPFETGVMQFEHPLLLFPMTVGNIGLGISYTEEEINMGYNSVIRNYGHYGDDIPTLEEVGIHPNRENADGTGWGPIWDSVGAGGLGGSGLGGSNPYPDYEYRTVNENGVGYHSSHEHRIAVHTVHFSDLYGLPAGPPNAAYSADRWCKLKAQVNGKTHQETIQYTTNMGGTGWTNTEVLEELGLSSWGGISNTGDGHYPYLAFYCGDNGEFCGASSPTGGGGEVDPSWWDAENTTTTDVDPDEDDPYYDFSSELDVGDPQKFQWTYMEDWNYSQPDQFGFDWGENGAYSSYITTITCQYLESQATVSNITPIPSGTEHLIRTKFWDPTLPENNYFRPYTDRGVGGYWDFQTPATTFPKDSSVGQIFIKDNINKEIVDKCKFEFNTGYLSQKSIYDSSGKANKGLLIGDYKVKKTREGEPMRRDSFIKVPKKTGNSKGAL